MFKVFTQKTMSDRDEKQRQQYWRNNLGVIMIHDKLPPRSTMWSWIHYFITSREIISVYILLLRRHLINVGNLHRSVCAAAAGQAQQAWVMFLDPQRWTTATPSWGGGGGSIMLNDM